MYNTNKKGKKIKKDKTDMNVVEFLGLNDDDLEKLFQPGIDRINKIFDKRHKKDKIIKNEELKTSARPVRQ